MTYVCEIPLIMDDLAEEFVNRLLGGEDLENFVNTDNTKRDYQKPQPTQE